MLGDIKVGLESHSLTRISLHAHWVYVSPLRLRNHVCIGHSCLVMDVK
jgi:hypothetical protein